MSNLNSFSKERAEILNICNENLFKSNQYLGKIIADNKQKLIEIEPIINFIKDRISTVLLLASENKIYDGEIIFRSLLEAFIKYFYILYTGEERE